MDVIRETVVLALNEIATMLEVNAEIRRANQDTYEIMMSCAKKARALMRVIVPDELTAIIKTKGGLPLAPLTEVALDAATDKRSSAARRSRQSEAMKAAWARRKARG